MKTVSFFHDQLCYINVTTQDHIITALHFSDEPLHTVVPCNNALYQTLIEYLDGTHSVSRLSFSQSGTSFQQTVWSYLSTIPYGTTQTYKQVAESMGIPNAIRAIATAIADNKIALLVPCHRVIGSDGSLHGFAWGLHRKQYLLEHEKTTSTSGMVR